MLNCLNKLKLLVELAREKKKDSQRVNGCTEEAKHRYPRRNVMRRNYTEMEVPDDDHYICELLSGGIPWLGLICDTNTFR